MANLDANSEEQGIAAQTEPPFSRAKKLPKPVKDDFLAKLRLHRKRYGW